MVKQKNNKKNKEKELILWEGFRKELPWILFWLLIGVMAYGYYQDKKICEEVLSNPCNACYKLNQTLMNSDYLFADSVLQDTNDIYINESLILIEDKNPNARTMYNYRA